MNNSVLFLCAIRGPVMLIAFGILMLLRQTADLSFSKSWPILFIVFGILKLAERLVRPVYVPPAGPGMAGRGDIGGGL